MDFGFRPISRPKSKIFYEQNVIILYTHAKFQASRFNNEEKKFWLADQLKGRLPFGKVFFIIDPIFMKLSMYM